MEEITTLKQLKEAKEERDHSECVKIVEGDVLKFGRVRFRVKKIKTQPNFK
jgi:hypothetical protein